MTYEVREPTLSELKLFLEFLIVPKLERVNGLFRDGVLVAIAGLIQDPRYAGSLLEEEARTIAFLEVRPDVDGAAALDIVRRLRGELRAMGRTVFIQHDDELPKSEKLLRVLGFKPTDEIRRDLRNTGKMLRVWKWQC